MNALMGSMRIALRIVRSPANMATVRLSTAALLDRHPGRSIPVVAEAKNGEFLEFQLLVVGFGGTDQNLYFSGYLPEDFRRLRDMGSGEQIECFFEVKEFDTVTQTGTLTVPPKYADIGALVGKLKAGEHLGRGISLVS